MLSGWLGLAAGAWFVVGPAVSLTWHHSGNPIGAPLGGDVRTTFELVGFYYGLGALIIALVAFASGRFASRPALEPDDAFAGAPVAAASLNWMLELLTEDVSALPLEGWRLDAQMSAAHNGYINQSLTLWGPGGVPVALGRQTMMVFG